MKMFDLTNWEYVLDFGDSKLYSLGLDRVLIRENGELLIKYNVKDFDEVTPVTGERDKE